MPHKKTHFKYLPIAVMILGFLISGITAWKYRKFAAEQEHQHFLALTEKIESEIIRRIHQFNYGLRGTAALWPASTKVTRSEFAKMVQDRNLEEEFKGALGIGFIRRVNREDLESFLTATRADDAPNFTVKTSGDHPDLFIIEFINPEDINQQAIGYDIGQETNRRTAAEQAMLTGKPVITAPIKLVQLRDEGPGFLLLKPVYKNGSSTTNELERRENLIGWTYMPLVASRILKGVSSYVDGELDFEVFHGDQQTSESLIFDNDDHLETTRKTSFSKIDYPDRLFLTSKKINISGKNWTLACSTNKKFHRSSYSEFYSALIGGTAITLLISSLIATLSRSTSRAYEIADKITLELHANLKKIEMLSMVATGTTNAVVICDEHRNITWINEGFTRITGYTLEDALGKSPGKLLQSELSDQKTIEAIRRSLDRGEPINCEILNRSKSGNDYWMDVNIVPIRNDSNVITGFMSIQLDISERKKSEQAIKEETERTAIALAAGELGLWDWNIISGHTIFDERWAYMLGEKQEDLTPNIDEWIKRCHPDDYILTQKALEKHFKGETPLYECRHRMKHRDGTWRWIIDSGKVVFRGSNGEALRMVGTHRDVTDQYNAQLESERLIAALNHTGKLAKVGSWQYSISDQTVHWSDQVKNIHEVDSSYIPQLHTAYAFYPKEAFESIRSLLERAISTGTPYDVELPLITAKGNHLWVRAMGEALIVDGVTVAVRGAFQDITDSHSQQIALSEAKKIAEQANQAKADFLANMSHEIRTPMNTVIGMTELLQYSPLNEEQKDFVDMIRNSGENLLVLINDILDFSKIESGNLELEKIPVHLRDCVETTVKTIALPAAKKGLDLVISIDPNIPTAIYTDKIRLTQILINLLTNAVKFTESGKIKITISRSSIDQCHPENPNLHFAISDTGIGIPKDRIDRLFKSFSQVDASTTRKYGGTGLGLVICARLIKLMGGRIWVESTLGTGSTFHFEIPDKEAPWTSEIISETPSITSSHDDLELSIQYPFRILIAEDIPINQRVATLILGRLGYTAEIAKNGNEALEILEQHPFDIIFMDVQMPIMDGLTCTREICSTYPIQNRPWIIAMTANAQKDDRQICLNAGMDDYISKPINKNVIIDALLNANEGLLKRRDAN